MELIGKFGSSIGFKIYGGAELKDCVLQDHDVGIIRYGGYEGGDEFKIKDSTITNVENAITVNQVENEEDVKATFEKLSITECNNGIEMLAGGELKVKETTITGSSTRETIDGIYTSNTYPNYHNVTVVVKDSFISGFEGRAVGVIGVADEVEIKNSELRDSYNGLQVSNAAKKVSVRDTVIEDMGNRGISIDFSFIIEKVELKDISVCNSGWFDIVLFYIGPTGIQEVKTGGDVYCDSARDYAAAESDITDKYCTASCA